MEKIYLLHYHPIFPRFLTLNDINGIGATNPGKIFLKIICGFFRVKINQTS